MQVKLFSAETLMCLFIRGTILLFRKMAIKFLHYQSVHQNFITLRKTLNIASLQIIETINDDFYDPLLSHYGISTLKVIEFRKYDMKYNNNIIVFTLFRII